MMRPVIFQTKSVRCMARAAFRTGCIALVAVACGWGVASAQGQASCNTAELQPTQLYGEWKLRLWPLEGGSADQPTAQAAVHFERHPEYPGSVRGRLQALPPTGERLLSGDATDGEFQLDESEDGVAISAVWHAVVNPADCGRRIQGTRRPAEGRPATEVPMNFELTKAPGWQ
jgi:hypothetical protein